MLKLDEIWLKFNSFQSASTVQFYLKKCYLHLSVTEAERKSYDNCYPFMYFLEQAETYYKQASSSPFSIKPVLLFYGFVHLIKAGLLTVDPYYPSSTSVLAHGVSTRKKKKRNYQFFQDEVKIQRNGLCTHFAEKMFQMNHLEGEKFKMGDLLALIPELDDLFQFIHRKRNIILFDKINDHWHIPIELTHTFHMGEKRLKNFLEEKNGGMIHWETDELIIDGKQSELNPPFRYHLFKNLYGINASLEQLSTIPDIMVHYLLLYNLSMIARYETEWWFDLIKTAADDTYPFIHTFLEISEIKCPRMIFRFLMKQYT
ncbi:YaaC family protein [Bacillus norwichensis]|uniref:YaaC family protein n=1 Tax=Bacillus norwichensis TaxID=2762217 RepID=A0ABR8VM62_9BACI|nr:YaaC family protein [Bacillus norwichensis]MBD8005864.1 YaaC family protein [Bacillus norwichensis]